MGAPVSVDACKGRAGRRSGRVQALGTAGTREAWCPGSGSQASEGPCQQGMAPGGASACSAASQVRHDTAGEAKGQAPALQGGQEVHRQPAPPTAPHHPPSHPSRRPTGQRRSGLAGGTYLHQRVVQRQQAVPQAQRGARRLGHAVPLVQLLWRGGGGRGVPGRSGLSGTVVFCPVLKMDLQQQLAGMLAVGPSPGLDGGWAQNGREAGRCSQITPHCLHVFFRARTKEQQTRPCPGSKPALPHLRGAEQAVIVPSKGVPSPQLDPPPAQLLCGVAEKPANVSAGCSAGGARQAGR